MHTILYTIIYIQQTKQDYRKFLLSRYLIVFFLIFTMFYCTSTVRCVVYQGHVCFMCDTYRPYSVYSVTW